MTPGQADSDANASSHSTNGGLGLLSMTQYAVTAAPIDGLKVSASYYETSDEGNLNAKQEAEGSAEAEAPADATAPAEAPAESKE